MSNEPAGEATLEPETNPDADHPGEDLGEEAAAPPVVAVLVTRDPGPWLDETLAGLRDQDYPNLSVLVLDAASAEDPTPRIAAVHPGAFVRRLTEDRGFGANANGVLGMVEGASHLLFVHDDAAPEPGAVRAMVEEAYRSNAGIVAPKLVTWDDPYRILSVGMNADKGGALADRVVPGELDQEQHDAVRDVFCAPGAFLLVRADLFAALGGFDPAISMFGEDLDLSWRAQVAGARVVVAPAARVRHIEVTRSGTQWRDDVHSGEDVRALQRRHELRSVLVCYGPVHRLRVVPQLAAASLVEIAICLVSGKTPRARSIVGAWKWNRAMRGDIAAARARLAPLRRVPDSEVRQFQIRGFARLSSLIRRLVAHYEGVDTLTLGGVEPVDPDATEDDESAGAPDIVSPTMFKIAGRWEVHRPSWVAAAWLIVCVLLAFGMRHFWSSGLPVAGQIPADVSPFSLLHHYISEGRAAGLGAYTPAPVAFGILGIAATVAFGSTAFVMKLLFLGAIPAGALGMYRLARPLRSRLAKTMAVVAYLVNPLLYDAFAAGKLHTLVAMGATPWVLAALLRATGAQPFRTGVMLDARRRRVPESRGVGPWVATGLLLAATLSFEPGEILVVAAMVAGLVLGSVLVRGMAGSTRALRFGLGALAIAAVLLGPWLLSFAGPWHGLATLAGSGGAAQRAPGLADILRFHVGPLGAGIAGWALLVPPALAVLVGHGWRYAWAVRMWSICIVSWLAAWVAAHGWIGGVPADPSIFLVAGACALAAAVAFGASAFEVDMALHSFGWRQLVPIVSAAGIAIASLPVLGILAAGRLDLPASGWEADLATAAGSPHDGLTLWIGDPHALPLGTWPLTQSTSYGVSDGVVPDLSSSWPPVDPHLSAQVGAHLAQARSDQTTELGRPLAALSIHYVVVPLLFAPGGGTTSSAPAPWVVPALQAQDDLEQVEIDPSVAFFVNTDFPASHHGAPIPHAPLYRYLELALQGAVWVAAIGMVVAFRPAARRRATGGTAVDGVRRPVHATSSARGG